MAARLMLAKFNAKHVHSNAGYGILSGTFNHSKSIHIKTKEHCLTALSW